MRSRKSKNGKEFVVKIFVRVEYECPRGHRFMASAPDKVPKATGFVFGRIFVFILVFGFLVLRFFFCVLLLLISSFRHCSLVSGFAFAFNILCFLFLEFCFVEFCFRFLVLFSVYVFKILIVECRLITTAT